MTIRRFGGRAFSASDLVHMGALPEAVLQAARTALESRRNVLVSGGTGSGKTTLLNALIELLPEGERIVAIEDTLELKIERANCLRFEAGAAQSETSVSIRNLVRHALRHRPDHIVVGEVRGAEAADLLQALNTGHGGSLTTVHANNARSALSRLASCAMQAGDALPWEVTCRGVVDGIHLVLHVTRREGRRFVEEALRSARATTRLPTVGLTEPIWSEATKPREEAQTYSNEGGEPMPSVTTEDRPGRDARRLRPGARTGRGRGPRGAGPRWPKSTASSPRTSGTEDEIRGRRAGDPHGREEEDR